jgi:site-specific recombinase XerD
MSGTTKLMAGLLYGAGLRINECITLRVQDIDLTLKTVTIRNGKGQKARVVLMPQKLVKPLEKHLLKRKQLHVDELISISASPPYDTPLRLICWTLERIFARFKN